MTMPFRTGFEDVKIEPQPQPDDPNIKILSNMTDYFTKAGMSPSYTPQELEAMRQDRAAAQETNYAPGIKGLLALIALHALGGKRGAASAGASGGNFTQSFMQTHDQGIKQRVADVGAKWNAIGAGKQSNADIMKAVIPEVMKERFKLTAGTGLPDKARLYEYRKNLPPDQQAQFDAFVNKPSDESTPTDIKIFQALYPNSNVATPEGRQQFLTLQSQLKNDPYMPLAIQMVVNDIGLMRATPEQRLQAAQDLAGKMKQNRIGGAPAPAPAGGLTPP